MIRSQLTHLSQRILHTCVHYHGSSQLLMNRGIDELICCSQRAVAGILKVSEKVSPLKRKSLRWPARKAQPYSPIPLVGVPTFFTPKIPAKKAPQRQKNGKTSKCMRNDEPWREQGVQIGLVSRCFSTLALESLCARVASTFYTRISRRMSTS
jgi:hypothetical protein